MATPTAERLSVMLGLVVLMLANVPRYLATGHDTQLTLILMAAAAVAAVSVAHWRMLEAAERTRLPALFKRFGLCLVAGGVLMGAWHALFTDWISWQLLLAHGATLGLLLHAVWLWVRMAD
ncbi:hypothetical protein [Billgrantia campisalis]|nr:hypothetical protein [Halomonas campisalis]